MKGEIFMDKLKAASFFAGVGGIDLGFSQHNVEIVYANEFDKYAVQTYEFNSRLKVDCRDIRTVKSEEIPDFDILLGGFPCQAFSSEGKREGFADKKNRGTLIYELCRIIKDKKPRAFLLENVYGLVHHDHGRTLQIILNALKKMKYNVQFAVMNSKDYGNIPQNRVRIYIAGFRNRTAFRKFKFPDTVELTNTLERVLDFESKIDDRYYISPNRYRGGIYENFVKIMDNSYSVYRFKYHRYEKKADNICFCLTASMRSRNIPVINTKYGIRQLTPQEFFKLQGFPDTFRLPNYVSHSQLYKQAGNSVSVSVISRIAEQMVKVL